MSKYFSIEESILSAKKQKGQTNFLQPTHFRRGKKKAKKPNELLGQTT